MPPIRRSRSRSWRSGRQGVSVGGALSRLALAASRRRPGDEGQGRLQWVRNTVPSKDLKAIFKAEEDLHALRRRDVPDRVRDRHPMSSRARSRSAASSRYGSRAHAHPCSRRSPWPGGGELPRDYWSGTIPSSPHGGPAPSPGDEARYGICSGDRAGSITTAKEVATLDRLTNGRVLFGIGGG